MKTRTLTGKFGKLLCLTLILVLMLGIIPSAAVSADSDDSVETADGDLVTTESEPEPAEPEPEPTPEPETATYENSVGGTLWIDANEDGTYDGDESPLVGYPVYLYLAGDTDNAVMTAQTDANGKYLFEDIEPSRYLVGIKVEENGTGYLLPLMGVKNDNKFSFTPDWSKVISAALDIAADTVVTGIDAAMRNMPGIQPMADFTGSPIDINDTDVVPAGVTGCTFTGGVLTFTDTATTHTYVITGTGTATSNRIVVNTGVIVNITLSGVNISNAVSPFRLLGTANVALTLSGVNTLTCTGTSTSAGVYQAGLHVAPTAAFSIDGTAGDTLGVTGGYYSAGIGGSYMSSSTEANNDAGMITITGGAVDAGGGGGIYGGAGIGGGLTGAGGIIKITGGTVSANGGGTSSSSVSGAGAGIGGGAAGEGGEITISGTADITATGGATVYGASGIGGGSAISAYPAGGGGTIEISGSAVKVSATGGYGVTYSGAGIGGGAGRSSGSPGGNGGTIKITDSTVNATGGGGSGTYGGAGIGGGSYGGSGGNITIAGIADITATGGAGASGGAGIGGGCGGDTYSGGDPVVGGSGGTIKITGGTITAKGGSLGSGGAGIGGGAFGGSGGDIAISGTADITATGGGGTSCGGAGIGGGGSNSIAYRGGNGGTIKISGSAVKVTATGGATIYGGAGIGGGSNNGSTYHGGNGGTIEITGGTVKATGRYYGAGIGGGYDATGGDITIGGTANVTATGGDYGAGIGGGYRGAGGDITIDGTADITATGGGTSNGGAGIGGGCYGDGGTITIGGTADVTATGGGTSNGGAGIGGGFSTGTGAALTLDAGATVKAYSRSSAYPAIHAASVTGTGYFVNVYLDAVISSTEAADITVDTAGTTTHSLTLPANYACFAYSTGASSTQTDVKAYLSTVYQGMVVYTPSPQAVGTLTSYSRTAADQVMLAHKATVKYVDNTGAALAGQSDVMRYVKANQTFNFSAFAPTISGYNYTGHKIGSWAATLVTGTTTASAITADTTLYLVYAPDTVTLTVSKTVTGDYADKTKAFTFTVTLQDSSGAPLTGTLTYAGSGAPSGYGILTLVSGSASFTLTHGQSITIAGVPASGKVQVVESDYTNYTPSFTDSVTGSGTGADTGLLAMTGVNRTVDFTNTRSVTPGGVSTGSGFLPMAILLLLGALSWLVMMMFKRRGKASFKKIAPLCLLLVCIFAAPLSPAATAAPAANPVTLTVDQIFTQPAASSAEDTFTYKMTPETDDPIPAGSTGVHFFTVDGTGSVDIDPISFTKTGVYSYEIEQYVASPKTGYTYDDRVYTVTIYVDYQLEVEVIIENENGVKTDGIEFENIYTYLATDPSIMVDPPVNKTVSGTPSKDGTFTFKLEAEDSSYPMPSGSADGVKTMTIVGSGTEDFGTWSYTDAGTYYYTVLEVNDGVSGYTYDTAVYTITDRVTDEDGQLVLDRTVTNASGKQVEAYAFINKYTAAASTSTDDTPKTGDDARTGLYRILLAISGLALTASALYLRRNRGRKRKRSM